MITSPKTKISPFLTIPRAEIESFLEHYQLAVPLEEIELYRVAWNFLLNNSDKYIPSMAIADFLLAYQHQDRVSQRWTTSSIILASDEESVPLATSLGLHSVNKERIVRMLGYLDLLDTDFSFFDHLPEEILWFIGTKLDCQSLGLLCQISSKFNKLVELFRTKLQEITRLDLTHYNKEQLGFLCRAGTKHNTLAGGNAFSLVCNSQGQVFSFGSNEYGQLGLNDLMDRTTPTSIEQFEGVDEAPFIVSIAAMSMQSLLLDSQGQVWSFGLGHLGLGDHEQKIIPTILKTPKIIAISVGEDNSLLLDSQGRVWGFGANDGGELGTGDQDPRGFPELIETINTEIIAISAGGFYSLVLNRVGQVLGFGDNDYGQLGLGDFERRLSPEAIEVIDDSLNQCLIIAISAGHSHSLVLDDQGRVFSFGNNEYGQLGLAEEGVGSTYREDPVPYPTMIQQVQDVVAISAGSRHSLLLDSYGLVWAFGWGIYGELGVGTYLPTFYPKMSKEIQEVIAIYAGEEFSLFIDAQDHVFSCGQYKQGQLGLEISPGRTEPITKPTMIKDFII